MASTRLSSRHIKQNDGKVDHQPAGNGEKDGAVATNKVAEKVEAGRL